MSSDNGSALDPPPLPDTLAGPPAHSGHLIEPLPITPLSHHAPEAAKKPAGKTVGRYPISGEIARGGMGAVLRGHDPDLGRDLAIKVLLAPSDDPDLLRRFVEEAQIGGQLQHPGIVPVYEIGTYENDRPYFTMKLVQGQTLGQLLHLRREPARDLPRFLGIFLQICQTMAYAHSRGVIHRDLKPGNIMVGSFGEVQIMDWGLAKVLNRPDSATPEPPPNRATVRTIRTATVGAESVAGTVSGTPAYMAPEQARGETDRVGPPSDVFALGSILCEILTGQAAYKGDHVHDTYHHAVEADLRDAVSRLEHCKADPPLVQLARKCLESDPQARPADAGVLAQELTAYLDGVQDRLRRVELERVAAAARATAEKRSRRLKQTLGGLVALTLLGLVVAGWWSYDKRVRLLAEGEIDLLDAEKAEREGNRVAARMAFERANSRLGSIGPDDFRRRLRRVDDDLKMVEKLEEIRLLQAEVSDGHFNHDAALPEYARAFQQFQLDVLTLPPEEAVQRLRASAIRPQLLAALDDWLFLLRGSGTDQWQRVLEIVQQADDDERRQQLRAAWAAQDWPRLQQLAQPQEIAVLSPATALFVSVALVRGHAVPQALEVLEAAQREHPADFWLNHRLAFTLHTLTNRLEEAVGYYRAALALRPHSPGVYVNLSLALDRLGRHDDAEAECRKAIQLQPDYAEAHTNLALFLRKRQRLSEADEELQKALALKPQLANAHRNLFYLREKQGRFEEAATAMREALKLAPNDAVAHHDFGVFLLQRQQPAAAVAQFRAAVQLQENNAAYHAQLAYALDKNGQPDAALTEYDQALKLDNQLALAHTNRGALLFKQGQFAAAEKEQRAALAADPSLALAHLNLGITLARQNQLDEAVRALQEAVRLQPGNGYAQYHLALTLARQGKPAEAETAFRQAIERDGDLPELQCRLGLALCEQGRFREGYELIRRGHERGASQPGWNLPSATWLKQYQRDAELDERLPAVLEEKAAPKDAAEWLDFARLCQVKKRYAAAVKSYERAFAANPSLAADYRNGGGRGTAARAAALAASGQGIETLDDATRSRLRQQALAWLRTDVQTWSRGLESGSATFRENVRRSLTAMQRDPALAGVRDDMALAQLPKVEREACRQFWASVGDLLRRVGEK